MSIIQSAYHFFNAQGGREKVVSVKNVEFSLLLEVKQASSPFFLSQSTKKCGK